MLILVGYWVEIPVNRFFASGPKFTKSRHRMQERL